MMQRLHDHFPALCRLFIGGNAVVSWYNSYSDPQSHLFRIARTADGGVLLWCMGLAGAAIVLDVLLNDWTPDRITIGRFSTPVRWKRAWRYRHVLFILLAFCYMAQPFVAERAGRGLSLFAFFFWGAIQNITIAFFDVRQRLRSPAWQRVYS